VTHPWDDPNLNDPRHVRAEEELGEIEEVRERNEWLTESGGTGYVSPARRMAHRLLRVYSRGSSPGPAEPKISDDEVWGRELQRRAEYEQDRSQDDS
jgi:hypothetical protein